MNNHRSAWRRYFRITFSPSLLTFQIPALCQTAKGLTLVEIAVTLSCLQFWNTWDRQSLWWKTLRDSTVESWSCPQALANTPLRDATRNQDLQQKNLLSYFDTSQQQTPIPPPSAANILGQGANIHQTSIGTTLSSDQVLAMTQSPKTGPLNVHQATTDGQRSLLLLNDPSVSNLSSLTRSNADRNGRPDLMTNLLLGGLESSGSSTSRTHVTSPGPQSLLTPADLESLHLI